MVRGGGQGRRQFATHSHSCSGSHTGPGSRVPTIPPLQAKTKGLYSGVDIGVKYSEKQERNFDDATMKAGQCVIGLQVGARPLQPWGPLVMGFCYDPGPVHPVASRLPGSLNSCPPPCRWAPTSVPASQA